MGFFKIIGVVFVPVGVMIYAAFSLRELPLACRTFGQNIGLGYRYFKVILKVMKPKT